MVWGGIMEEKEKYNGFDDTGWDDIEEYSKSLLKRQKNKREKGELNNIPDFIEILEKERKKQNIQ